MDRHVRGYYPSYLNVIWRSFLIPVKCMQIVKPSMQHHGISSQLIEAVLEYAHEKKLVASLETHNEQNV